MCCWIPPCGQSALPQTSLTAKWIPVPQTTGSQLILHLFMWRVFIPHCLIKVFIFKPLCSLVPHSLSACVLLSVRKAIYMCLCISHMGSQAIGKIEDHWIIQAGIPNPVWASLIPVYASCLSLSWCAPLGSVWLCLVDKAPEVPRLLWGGALLLHGDKHPSLSPATFAAGSCPVCMQGAVPTSLLPPSAAPGPGNRFSPPAGTVMLCCGCAVLCPCPW